MGRARARALPVFGVVVVLAFAGCRPVPPGGHGRAAVQAPIAHEGRWFTDASGRVVTWRGMNFVQKSAPYHPAAVGFGDDDAAMLAANGFNAFRLGVELQGLMPEPGRIDTAYLEQLADTVRVLGRHGIFVLLDFHQDGYGPVTRGNGFPAWATLTDGLPNPDVPFPLYYVQNPALQRAFDNFWANRPGPDGVPLQEHYATAMRAVAARFAAAPNVLGYEAMNEPWPGSDWSRCSTGCPDLEQSLLGPFYRRMVDAVRAVDRSHFVFVEPFVLFNFGHTDTTLGGLGSPLNGLSTHVYALSAADDQSVIARSVAATNASGDAFLVTEWGATNDTAKLDRTTGQLDAAVAPWMFWAYNENVIVDTRRPPTSDNLHMDVLDALARPYPVLTAGTPAFLGFDRASGTLDYAFVTRRPDGRRARHRVETAITIPRKHYASGYTVSVVGATVTSPPCAPTLALRNAADTAVVWVHVTRGGTCRSR